MRAASASVSAPVLTARAIAVRTVLIHGFRCEGNKTNVRYAESHTEMLYRIVDTVAVPRAPVFVIVL